MIFTHLGNEDQCNGDGGAEYDEETNNKVSSILSVFYDEGDGNARHTHDDHVVHRHADVLGIIQGRYAHVACLPS